MLLRRKVSEMDFIKCLLGWHMWDGCRCLACGKVRAIDHTWDGCICSVCGATRDEGHDWTEDCEKCARCGKIRTNAHTWGGCRCSVCGKPGALDAHTWDGYRCTVCGYVSPVVLELTQKLDIRTSGPAEKKQAHEALVRMGPSVLEALFEIKHKVCVCGNNDGRIEIERVIAEIGVSDVTFLLKMLRCYNRHNVWYSEDILKRIQELADSAAEPREKPTA